MVVGGLVVGFGVSAYGWAPSFGVFLLPSGGEGGMAVVGPRRLPCSGLRK